MAKQSRSKRAPKKELLKRMEREFDLHRLNYPARVKMVRPKSMLIGLVTAGGLYMVGFALAYMAMTNNSLPLENFSKLVFMLMIPTTIAGFFAWQLSKNRMEFPIREDIRACIADNEKGKGILWRFAPVLELFDDVPLDVKKAVTWSEEGRTEKLDVEEYTEAVLAMYEAAYASDDHPKLPEVIAQVNTNYNKTGKAA